MVKEIKSKFVWKLLRLLPFGLRLKVASRFDDRVNRLFYFYGESLRRNTDMFGNIDMVNACLEEKDESKRERLIDTWVRCRLK